MSHVASMLLYVSGTDSFNKLPETIDLYEHPAVGVDFRFQRLDLKQAGGNKVMQCYVWGAAVNYCDVPALLKRIEAVPWKSPEDVMLIVRNEHDARPSVYGFRTTHVETGNRDGDYAYLDDPREFVQLLKAVGT